MVAMMVYKMVASMAVRKAGCLVAWTVDQKAERSAVQLVASMAERKAGCLVAWMVDQKV